MSATLSELHRYPVKSIAADSLQSAVVEPRGLRGDRRWLVVDPDGKALTGRECGALTQIRAQLDGDALTVTAPSRPDVRIAPLPDSPRVHVTVWGDAVDALPADAAADAWITDYLGRPARLVFMDERAHRAVEAKYAQPGDEVSFADGFPLLLISQAALDTLNAKLSAPIPMQRFRPNFVVTGTEPHAEDGWSRIRIGDIAFDVLKPCTRCIFTTVDIATGERDPAGEPLRTLIGYRRTPKGVTFGMNVIPRGTGTLRVGDAVTVLA